MSILAECVFLPSWDIKNSCWGVRNTDRGFFFSRKVVVSVSLSLCYFIRIIKGIAVQVMGS